MRPLLAALVWTLLLPACALEAEVTELCRTLENQQIPAAPSSTVLTQARTFEYDLPADFQSLEEQGLTSQIRLVSARLIPRSGVTDLGFAQAAALSISGPEDSGLPEIVLADYQRASGSGAVEEILFTPPVQPDLLDYVRARKIRAVAELTGQMPTTDWAVDVKLCFHVSGRVALTDLAMNP